MKVLLLADIRGVGRRGEVKEVAEGYGRNFLIAKKLATPAAGGALAAHSSQQAQKSANESQRLAKLKELIPTLEKATITFYLRTDAKGNTFGSVKPEEILRAVADEFGSAPDKVVSPKDPLKTAGDHTVVVSWKPDLKATFTAQVRPQS